jgi:hypothetical protein
MTLVAPSALFAPSDLVPLTRVKEASMLWMSSLSAALGLMPAYVCALPSGGARVVSGATTLKVDRSSSQEPYVFTATFRRVGGLDTELRRSVTSMVTNAAINRLLDDVRTLVDDHPPPLPMHIGRGWRDKVAAKAAA